MAWIILVRAIILMLLNLIATGWPWVAKFDRRKIHNTWNSIKPLLLGSSIYKTSPIIDRYFASMASSGGLTLVHLAQTAVGVLATVLERSVSTPRIPTVSRLVKDENFIELKRVFRQGVITILLICLAIAVSAGIYHSMPILFLTQSLKVVGFSRDFGSSVP